MEIWQAGNRLVMMVETDPDLDPAGKAARDAADPDVQAWARLMERFQRRLPFAEARTLEAGLPDAAKATASAPRT